MEKIPKSNKRRASNKDVGPEKNQKLIKPMFIPDYRVLFLKYAFCKVRRKKTEHIIKKIM